MLEILGKSIKQGYQSRMLDEASKVSHNGEAKAFTVKTILNRDGMIGEIDSQKVVSVLEYEGAISVIKFRSLLDRAKDYAKENSEALKKVKHAVAMNGQPTCQRMEDRDYNKDGKLNFDGFEGSMSYPENKLDREEMREAFNLVCDREGNLNYQEWVTSLFSEYKDFFSIAVAAADPEPSERPDLSDGESVVKVPTRQPEIIIDEYKLQSAKTKMENYVVSQDLNLSVIFAVIDTDSNNSVDFPEFKQKVRGLHMNLDSEEIDALFRAIDSNGNG